MITSKLGWGLISLMLMCIGIGAVFQFSRTLGLIFLFIGVASGYLWYRRHGTKRTTTMKPGGPVNPANMDASEPPAPKKYVPLDKMDRR